MRAVLADSGFLVALGIQRDPRHAAAKAFLSRYGGKIIVPSPVVPESCYFLSVAAKIQLLDWISKPPVTVAELPVHAHREIGAILERYEALDPDFTDGAIVWLADILTCRAILTVDTRDFAIYRLQGRKRFELVKWF